MLPLTAQKPKPLLQVGSKTLIEHQIQRLLTAGITELVINVAYLGKQIQAALGDGSHLGVHIQYSPEVEPLETGGGVFRALPLLGDHPFVLVNSDIWCDYPLEKLCRRGVAVGGAHLVLVENPVHHRGGDFTLTPAGKLCLHGRPAYTFSGISVIHPQLIAAYPERRQHFPLKEVFAWGAELELLTGEVYDGEWVDVGTPERLAEVRQLPSAESE